MEKRKKTTEEVSPEEQKKNEKVAVVGTLALSGLKLDKSIDPTIPSSVIDAGAGLRGMNLAAGNKSLERCLLQQSVSEFKTNVAMVKMQLCSLTSMAGLEWGKAYNIDMSSMGGPGAGLVQDIPGDPNDPNAPVLPDDPNAPGGPGDPNAPGGPGEPGGPSESGGPGDGGAPSMPTSLQVKMDNSVAGEYTIYVCSAKVLQQKILVKGATDTGATGSYAVKMDLGGDNVMELRGSFDNGVTSVGRYLGTTQMRFSMGGMKMNSSIALNLGQGDSDAHFVQSTREQAMSFADLNASTKELMAGRFGPDFGSAIVQRSGGDDKIFGLTNEAGPETSRAFFNVAGENVEESASASLAEGGTYYMAATDLPLLNDPAETWPIEGWDCVTGVEEFTPPTGGAEAPTANSCYDASPFADMQFSCFAGGFAPGMQMEGAEDQTAKRDENEDIFSTPPPPPPAPGGGAPTDQVNDE